MCKSKREYRRRGAAAPARGNNAHAALADRLTGAADEAGSASKDTELSSE
jgi:hypothetical protein